MTQKWELESSEMDSYLLCVLWKGTGPLWSSTSLSVKGWLDSVQAAECPWGAATTLCPIEGVTGHGFKILCDLTDCLGGDSCLFLFLSEPHPSSRETQDLPARAFSLTPVECLQTFVHAIFYVGKGTRARPDVHLWEALSHHRQLGKQV